MSYLEICRVCLASDLRLHVIENTPLQEIYEILTNLSLVEDGKPQKVCFICASYLKKARHLISRCLKADELLTQILMGGNLVCHNTVDEIDRHAHNLTYNLCSQHELIHNTAIPEEEITNDDKVEINLKSEVECDELARDFESNQSEVDNNIEASDSEDDIPLKRISVRNRLKRPIRKKVQVKKEWIKKRKDCRDAITNFASEIILSKEEQVRELSDRSKSLNYLNSPLKCDLCYKGFVDTKAYKNHTDKHDLKSGAHECEICRMRYRTSRQLRTHAATSHGRQYECHKCGHRSHTANQAREHEKWHNGHKYECKLCGQDFRKPTSYLTHMRKRHPTPHVCHICGDSFVGRHGLLMHNSKAHNMDQKDSDNIAAPSTDSFCTDCNIQFVTVEAWKRHLLSSARHTLGNENSLQCRICNLRYTSSAELGTHLREHRRSLKGRRPLPMHSSGAELSCDDCGAHFLNRSKLQAHVKRIHLGLKYNKNIVCEVCGKKCTSNASLKYHQRTHTGEKPYQCETCSKKFSDNNQLKIHIRTHTGERPYCCAACGKRFSQKPALNRHYRVHTGAKPYICTYCSKTFSQSNSVKLHVRTVHLKMPPNRRSNPQNLPQLTNNEPKNEPELQSL